jgi:uncharacterized protein (TIGR02302 family)
MILNSLLSTVGLNAANRTRLRLLFVWTRAVLIIESLLPSLFGLFALLSLFLSLSWLDVWSVMPAWARLISDIICLIIGSTLCARALYHIKFTQSAVLKRLDETSHAAHQLISTLYDHNALGTKDPLSNALWQHHYERATQHLIALPFPLITSHLSQRDPFSLRYLCVISLIASAMIAGPNRSYLLQTAMSWPYLTSTQSLRLDVWIDPPPYTGRAPLVLTQNSDHKITIPYHSLFVVHASDQTELTLDAPASTLEQDNTGQNGDIKKAIIGNGEVTLRAQGRMIASYSLDVIPDLAPKIELLDPLTQSLTGQLNMSYDISDDYGVTQASGLLLHPRVQGLRHQGRILIPAPDIPLNLPSNNGRGQAQTSFDFASSPWAGVHVDLQLMAQDEGGNIGKSKPRPILIPHRHFQHPLARALSEQRRLLAFSADDTQAISEAISAFLIDPDIMGITAPDYVNLRHILTTLKYAHSDQELIELTDFMWTMALHIEDGSLSDRELSLKAAEDALNQALKDQAPQSQIDQLMADYNKALQDYLAELSTRTSDSQMAEQGNNSSSQIINQNDIDRLVNEMNERARAGDHKGAQDILKQLQNIMRNLQAGRHQQDPRQQQAEQSLNELDHLMREEQMLQDQTKIKRAQKIMI